MKTFKAKVISDKMTKTAVVSMDLITRHPKYGKVVHKTAKLHVDNTVGAKTGDWVEIAETRKLSRTKSHKIVKIVK